MNDTGIAWTNKTWNAASGCEVISEGCKYCYALTRAEQLRGTKGFPQGFDLTLRPHRLREPLALKKACRIFVNSMSDLFWEKIPDSYRDQVLNIIELTPRHQYQVLTKRPN
jgi:protein gp37